MKLIPIIFAIGIFLSCKTLPQEIAVEKPATKPSLEQAIRKEFGHGSGIHHISFKFSKQGKYDLNYGSEGWYWRNRGNYTILRESLLLSAKHCEFWHETDLSCAHTFKSGQCTVHELSNNIEYLYELLCEFDNSFSMFTSGSEPRNTLGLSLKTYKVPTGSKRKFANFDVVTLGNVVGKVNTSVIVREGPGTNFKKGYYIVNAYDGPYLPSIPKGKVLTVHARTPDKQKVQEWDNYWLLVSIDDTNHAWVFGQFVDY